MKNIKLAVDLGTTSIDMCLLSFEGDVVAQRSIKNRQSLYGRDVINRILSTVRDNKFLKIMKDMVLDDIVASIGEMLIDISADERDITYGCICGNTTMISILLEYDITTMGYYPFKTVLKECVETGAVNIFGNKIKNDFPNKFELIVNTIKDIKSYKPVRNSLTSGQVLHCAYDYKKTKLIIKEMADSLSLDLVSKNLVTDQLILTIGYDIENLTNPNLKNKYSGEVTIDHYGRTIPKHAHGTINLDHKTSSSKLITESTLKLYDRIINKELLVKRINLVASNVIDKNKVKDIITYEQHDIFTDYTKLEKQREEELKKEKEEDKLQHTLLDIKNKYGKNSILKGMNLEEGGRAIDRNNQIGGHRA